MLLDQNEMAKGFKYFAIGDFYVSDDGNLLAYTTDTTGYRQYTLQIKDLPTGKMLPDKIERVTSLEWSNDGKYLFVGQEDPVSKRSDKVWRHTVGSRQERPGFRGKGRCCSTSASGVRVTARCCSSAPVRRRWTSTVTFRRTTRLGEWKIIAPRREGHQYNADFDNGEFYIVTNKDAENFKVVKAPLSGPEREELDGFHSLQSRLIHINGIDFFKDYAVVSEKENGLEYLRVMDRKSKRARGTHRDAGERLHDGVGSESRIRYADHPLQLFLDDHAEFDVRVRLQDPQEHADQTAGDPERLRQDTVRDQTRVWATARDGVKVPISIMMKKGTKLDGSAPMLLYAYGSYGISMTPSFSTRSLEPRRPRDDLRDRPYSRRRRAGRKVASGGPDVHEAEHVSRFHRFGEMAGREQVHVGGPARHSGRLGRRPVDGCGRRTCRRRRSTRSIAQVPFVDVMNTMLDADLPLTTEEWIEWGNPNEKKAWDYMVQYSPYDNVKAQKYPNMLVEISLNDSQVPYWEGAKFAAKIREMKTDNNTILLKTNMGAGHGGSSGRYDRLKEVAFDYAYALTQVGIEK